MKNKKLVIVEINEGGELGKIRGEYKEKKRIRKKRHNYFLLFWEPLLKFKISLPGTLVGLVGEMNFDNKLTINEYLIKKLGIEYNANIYTIKSNVQRIVKKGIGIKLSRYEYFINPYFFTKTSQYRVDNLRIEYGKLLLQQFMSTKDSKKKDAIAKQLKDLDPVWEANLILNNSKPFD